MSYVCRNIRNSKASRPFKHKLSTGWNHELFVEYDLKYSIDNKMMC